MEKEHLLDEGCYQAHPDDPMLYAMFRKEVDARRMPTIAAFVNARLSGVSIAAMDKLRFATIWTPGHSTLAKAVKEMEKHISTTWCPNGPVASWGTTRTAEEQRRTRTADVPMDVEDEDAEDEEDAADLDREVDEAMRAPPDEREAQAVSLEEQGLALLRLEFPLATQEEINDRWAGGLGETIDNGEGGPCNVVQVMAIRDGTRLAGFLKVLVTTKELWVEELLVDEGERGKRIAWRMMDRLLGEKGLNRKLLRLQVRKDNHLAIKLYVQGWLFKKWVERSSGNWMGCTAKPEETHELYESTCARTRDAINAFLTERPPQDDDGLVMKLFAAHQIPGVVFDRVGLEDEQDEEAVPPPMEGEHTEEDFDEAEAELARDGLQGLFAEDTEEAHDDAIEKDTGTTDPTEPVSPSHGLKSIVDAIQLLLISARTRDLTKMHAHRTDLYCVRNVRAQLAATCVSSSAPTLSTWAACRRRSATSRHSLLV
jgi:ribosomal protein S18 acetylase RimI-like enzyme